MPSDLEMSNQTVDGFFAADYRNINATAISNWVNPGDFYWRMFNGTNADGSDATPAQVAAAVTAWEAFTRAQRWRIRLHHQSLIKRRHPTVEVWLYYSTAIPLAARDFVRGVVVAGDLEYLGTTFSQARTRALQLMTGAQWITMFPNDTAMDQVVFGWEAANV